MITLRGITSVWVVGSILTAVRIPSVLSFVTTVILGQDSRNSHTTALHVSTRSPTSTSNPIALHHNDNDNDNKESIRPLHQNWWPVSLTNALDASKPNGIQVLGKKLVIVQDTAHTWKALDDRCSHRFAPLSEGRIVQDAVTHQRCVQCAYHGWEFSLNNGTCMTLPQQPQRIAQARPVQTYPTRTRVGMVWIWMDLDSYNEVGASIPLPVSDLLQRTYDVYGAACFFQRDLPYGMEVNALYWNTSTVCAFMC
jgi:nitrite reductase/ring-hydroxylating ferredoxin subunit